MKVVNLSEARTHLSRLLREAVAGEPFLIAKAGKPLVRVDPIRGNESEKEAKPQSSRSQQ